MHVVSRSFKFFENSYEDPTAKTLSIFSMYLIVLLADIAKLEVLFEKWMDFNEFVKFFVL